MKNFLAQIQKEVPLVIFDVPRIKEKSMKLFDENEQQIKERFNEIVTYLNMNDKISYKDVMRYFKLYFYQSILNDAVEIIFAPNYKYDILDIIVCSLLTKEKLLSAISGRPMIDAFSKVLAALPSTDALESCLTGSKIFLLEKEFLGDTLINQLL